MNELELMDEAIKRLDERYEFLARNRRNIGHKASAEFNDCANAVWDTQTRFERSRAVVADRYAYISETYGNG